MQLFFQSESKNMEIQIILVRNANLIIVKLNNSFEQLQNAGPLRTCFMCQIFLKNKV